MIYVKDHQQCDMFNPFEHLGPKRLALLESSWAHLFREKILHKLPAAKLFPLYDDLKGRPTKELYTMLGIVLLQQMEDLTDEATVRQFAFNLEWHYALNVTDPSDFNAYVAPRTLWTMRDQVGRLGLEQTLFEDVTGALTKLFALNPSKQRCTISYDAKSLRLARRPKQEKASEFKERYRYRAGVEATLSDLDRITGIKHLRVRGMPQVRLAAILKATGLSIHRATAFRSRQKQPTNGKEGAINGKMGVPSAQPDHLLTVKERLQTAFALPAQPTTQKPYQAGKNPARRLSLRTKTIGLPCHTSGETTHRYQPAVALYN